MASEQAAGAGKRVDVIVIGAGLGGVYAVWKFREQGLTVQGFESGSSVGGVWYHNRYPGARVDVDSLDYCYHFSEELYRDWQWTEKFATQPEILRYIDHVADRFDLRRHFKFNARVAQMRWDPDSATWRVTTAGGESFTARFVVMATGNLSEARKPPFAGLEDYAGEWVQTSHWPDRHIRIEGRRVGLIGTGSSGVQAAPVLAAQADHLHVFVRSPNFSVPAQNGPMDQAAYDAALVDFEGVRLWKKHSVGGQRFSRPTHATTDFTLEEVHALLEEKWQVGGHALSFVFTDQGVNREANAIVADFVRNKIRGIIKDSERAEALCPKDHPFGSRRLCVDTDFYATFNRDNVDVVDVRADPIDHITKSGIALESGREIPLDLIIFAIGFTAFRGALDAIDIRNEQGARPTDHWDYGPKTYLGLMTSGFPNLFVLTGPGSASVLANLVTGLEHHVDMIADMIARIDARGLRTIEADKAAEERWSEHVAEIARPLLRNDTPNYMVHVAPDGTRRFQPYTGGLDRYIAICDDVVARDYEGFVFG